MSQLKKDFTVAFQLSSVQRYSRDHMLKPENVLEHIGFCAFYSLLLASRLHSAGIDVDFAKLFRRVSVHDLDEAVLGDIPRTTKYFSEEIRKAFSVIEKISIRKLGSWFGFDFFEDWSEAKNGLEGQILKVTDMASVVYKNWVEIKMLQNRSFLRVALETQNYLVSLDTSKFPTILRDEVMALHNLNLETLNSFPVENEDYLFLHIKDDK